MVLKSLAYQTTAAGTTGSAAAAVAGNSLVIENAPAGQGVHIVSWWGMNQTSGFHQLIFPSGHDTTRGIRTVCTAAVPISLWPTSMPIEVFPQETLALTLAGSATAGDIEYGVFNLLYKELPGIATRLISPSDLKSRGRRLVTIQATLACGTGGGWTGSELITAESDLLKANTDYAIIGGASYVACAAIGITAPDFGNVRIALPVPINDPELSAGYFIELSHATGEGLIPVINSANRGNIFLDGLQDENGVDPIISINLVELTT